MNLERIRERKGQFNGHKHNHEGQRAIRRKREAFAVKYQEYVVYREHPLSPFHEAQEYQGSSD